MLYEPRLDYILNWNHTFFRMAKINYLLSRPEIVNELKEPQINLFLLSLAGRRENHIEIVQIVGIFNIVVKDKFIQIVS